MKDNQKVRGIVTVQYFRAGEIEKYDSLQEALEILSPEKEEVVSNLIVDTGFEVLANALVGDDAITYVALGTDNTAPASTDTVLGTETVRKAIQLASYVSKSIVTKTLFAAYESEYHFYEGGVFGGSATAVADSGTMFSHFLKEIDNDPKQWDIVLEYTVKFE